MIQRNVEVRVDPAMPGEDKTAFLFNCMGACGKQAGPFTGDINAAIRGVQADGWVKVEIPEQSLMQFYCCQECADWGKAHGR